MIESHKKFITVTVAALAKMGAVYTIEMDGEKFSNAPEKRGKKKRKPSRDYSSFKLKELVAGIEVGEVKVVVPRDGFTAYDIQANLSSRMLQVYGKNSFITTINKNREVEVMRTA